MTQKLLNDDNIIAVKAALHQIAMSDCKLLSMPKIKKSLKKITLLFGMKIKIEKPKPAEEKKGLEKIEEVNKKKKKKSKNKKKNEEEDISEYAPSFKRFVTDTTKVNYFSSF